MKASRLAPGEGLLLFGDFFEFSGQGRAAESTLEQARALGQEPRALERLSLGLLRRQAFTEAEALASTALTHDQQLSVAHYVRAVASMAQSSQISAEAVGRAERDLRRAIALDPGLARAYAVLGGLLATARQNPQAGLALTRRAVELEPSEVAHRVALAQVLILDGQADEARVLASAMITRADSEAERAQGERLLRMASQQTTSTSEQQRQAPAPPVAASQPPN